MGIIRLERLKPQPAMKVAIIVLAFVAVVSANYAGEKYWSRTGKNNENCFAQRCEACENFFQGQENTFDCEGQCGLCSLCNAATYAIVPNCARCKDGIKACIDTVAVVKRSVKIALVPVL